MDADIDGQAGKGDVALWWYPVALGLTGQKAVQTYRILQYNSYKVRIAFGPRAHLAEPNAARLAVANVQTPTMS